MLIECLKYALRAKREEANAEPEPDPVAEALKKEEAKRNEEAKKREEQKSEIDTLRAQIQACWKPLAGALDAKELIVRVRLQLRQNGSLSAEPILLNRGSHPLFQIAAESAMRAIRRCQPYKLPLAKYEVWKDVEVTFDPREG